MACSPPTGIACWAWRSAPSGPANGSAPTASTPPTEADERPTGAVTRITVTQGFEDVTATVVGKLGPRLDDRARHDAIDAAIKRLVASCERAPDTRCRVAAFEEGFAMSSFAASSCGMYAS